MSLTLSQPAQVDFSSSGAGAGRFAHDFCPRTSLGRSRLSPIPRVDSPVNSVRFTPDTTLHIPFSASESTTTMATHHRGLPPPSAMGLPDPARPPPPALGSHIGAMPAPPTQWHGHEESMRNWLLAKAEEDKRRQEEERTKQESFRFEQRRIEQSILRESLQAGMPPSLVPLIYAGLGGSQLVNIGLEWLQQHTAQLQASQQQVAQHSASPDVSRDVRLLGPAASTPPTLSATQPSLLSSQPVDPLNHSGPLSTTFPVYPPAASRAPPTSAPRSASTHSQLPRLTTNDIFTPSGGSTTTHAHPLQQTQTAQQEPPGTSPSIYFHHWVPPNGNSDTKASNPATPAHKSNGSGDHSSAEVEHRDSPRKRKATGPHHAAPPPPPSGTGSGVHYTSPPYSSASSGSVGPARKLTHARRSSDVSAKENEHRSTIRHASDTLPSIRHRDSSSSERPDLGERKPRDRWRDDGEGVRIASDPTFIMHQPFRPLEPQQQEEDRGGDRGPRDREREKRR